ncbi:MAG: organomercurial lyase [Acidimicrobiales bacterium]
MSDITDCRPPADFDRAIVAFRRHAFAALLAGEAPRLAAIAEAASRDALGVARALAWLDNHGQLERDGELLIGAHGLTHRPTPHTLAIGDRTLHTWCAYDAVAIPTALGITARAATRCPSCHQHLIITIHEGHLPDPSGMVLWLPSGPCQNVIDDFCTHANLYCNPHHLDTWHHSAGRPPGRPVTLAEIPALARNDWADVAPRQE